MAPLTPARQRLVVRYLPLARSLAKPFRVGWPGRHEDLNSAADLALVESAARFRSDRGVKFSTYARVRILGALCDTVREFVRDERTELITNTLLDALPEGEPRPGTGRESGAPGGVELDGIDETEHLIEGFPEQYRPLIRLIFVKGLTVAAAGAELGIERSTASNRLRRALAAWRRPFRRPERRCA